MNKIYHIIPLLLVVFLAASCASPKPIEKWTKKEAPAIFKARFETTQGNFDIEAHRAWSPKGVDRLYQLIKSEFYTDIALYRAVPNFVVQFGIHNDSILNTAWATYKVPDEPTLEKNLEGAISFARGGKETRTTQLFINLKSNSPRLDTLDYSGVKGFPVVAKVTKGMEVIKAFYDEYGEKPARQQATISTKGNAYLKENFPKLDYIRRPTFLNNFLGVYSFFSSIFTSRYDFIYFK